MPSGTSLDGETSPSWKYRSAEPSSMAPRLPIPRITLKRRPSSRKDSPGLSSVPASIEPIITLSAPAASALRSEEHTSELQSLAYLVCRLLLEKKKKTTIAQDIH